MDRELAIAILREKLTCLQAENDGMYYSYDTMMLINALQYVIDELEN